jgi:TolB-like protein
MRRSDNFGHSRRRCTGSLASSPKRRPALIAEPRENGERPAKPTQAPAVEAPVAVAQRDTDHPSIVVLPFENLSGPDDEYFVDGVVEEITAMLSRVRNFFVIARQSAFAYKGRRVDVREIGREFGVSYAVEGTVRRAADRVRIFVQLVDTGTRTQLWSERFDRATSDIFELEDEIAARVAGAVRPALLYAEIEAARRKPPGSLRAYELALTAYPKIWSATAEGNKQAIALLKEAIAIDPDYGRAHALLAWCHAQNFVYLWSSDPEADRALALAAVAEASRLASNDQMALTALAAAVLQCLADQDRAAAYVDEALWLDPNNAWAWGRSGWIAVYRDQPQTAKLSFERALLLSPLDPLEHNFRMGIVCAIALEGDYTLAARLAQRVVDKNPKVTWAYRHIIAYSALAGDPVTARDAVAKLRAASPGVAVTMSTSHPLRSVSRLYDVLAEGWRLAGLSEEK